MEEGGSEIKKIGILRALQLGDLMCCVPAVRSLRKKFPDAEIVLIGLPWAQDFVKRYNHYFSRFIHFPGFPGLPEQPVRKEDIIRFIEVMNEESFDLLLQMQGNGSIINPLLPLLGAKALAGFYERGSFEPEPGNFLEYPEGIHEIHRHLKLIEFLGIQTYGDELELPTSNQDEQDFYNLVLTESIASRYVCIHPGARDPRRRWPVDWFAIIADHLAEKGFQILITGSANEEELAAAIIKKMKSPAINLAGKTSLGTIALVVKNSTLVISNDTGISHIAAATKTKSIVIVLTSDPVRWAPINKTLHKVIPPEDAWKFWKVVEKAEHALMEETIATGDDRKQNEITQILNNAYDGNE